MIDALRTEIRKTIETYCTEPSQQENMLRILSRPGFALHQDGPCRTGLLALEIYRSIHGTLDDIAIRSAVAIELYVEASFILDRVADHDFELNNDLSDAEELALAVSLMGCGATAASEAVNWIDSCDRRLRALSQLHQGYIKCAGGQFLDARAHKLGVTTTDEALRITCIKAGSAGRAAAGFAANAATDDLTTVGLFEEFGYNLATYMQIIDDIRDACPENSAITDYEQNKQTLPLVYFAHFRSEHPTATNDDIIYSDSSEPVRHKVRQEFMASGAELFSAIIAETFLNRAKSNLSALKERAIMVDGFEHLISSVEFSPNEIFAVL